MKSTNLLNLERFEDRFVPSVTVSDFGDLVVEGGSSNDHVDIKVTHDGTYEVKVSYDGYYELFKGKVTPDFKPFSVFVLVDGGKDKVTVRDSDIPGELNVDLGGKRDDLLIKSTSVGKAINIIDGGGNDYVKVDATFAGGGVNINAFDGKLFSGRGDDTFILNNVHARSDYYTDVLNLGKGYDYLVINHSHFSEKEGVLIKKPKGYLDLEINNSTFTTPTDIITYTYSDYVVINHSHFTDLYIDSAGELYLEINNSSFTGDVYIFSDYYDNEYGGDYDYIVINHSHFADLYIDLGKGYDVVKLTHVNGKDFYIDKDIYLFTQFVHANIKRFYDRY